jgi:hypothetical protein
LAAEEGAEPQRGGPVAAGALVMRFTRLAGGAAAASCAADTAGTAFTQGLTLANFSAQRKRFLLDRGSM